MNKTLYILFAALVASIVSGCDEDFLDKKPSEQLSSEQISHAVSQDPGLHFGLCVYACGGVLSAQSGSKAKFGQDAPARDRLKKLLALRITDYSYVDALSGQALQDEIYLQTRHRALG